MAFTRRITKIKGFGLMVIYNYGGEVHVSLAPPTPTRKMQLGTMCENENEHTCFLVWLARCPNLGQSFPWSYCLDCSLPRTTAALTFDACGNSVKKDVRKCLACLLSEVRLQTSCTMSCIYYLANSVWLLYTLIMTALHRSSICARRWRHLFAVLGAVVLKPSIHTYLLMEIIPLCVSPIWKSHIN